MKNLLRSVSLIIVITMTVGVCACTSISSDISSNFSDEVLSDYDKVYESDDLIIPHVDMQNRDFVLKPLLDLCPNKRHPVLGLTMTQLYERLEER